MYENYLFANQKLQQEAVDTMGQRGLISGVGPSSLLWAL